MEQAKKMVGIKPKKEPPWCFQTRDGCGLVGVPHWKWVMFGWLCGGRGFPLGPGEPGLVTTSSTAATTSVAFRANHSKVHFREHGTPSYVAWRSLEITNSR